MSADDQVAHAIAVDVAGGTDRAAGKITRRFTVEHEAVAAVEAGQCQRRAELGGFAEHHVAAAGISAVGAGAPSADDQVVDAIAVDVASATDRIPEKSAVASPSIIKPFVPSILDSGSGELNPVVLPNTT